MAKQTSINEFPLRDTICLVHSGEKDAFEIVVRRFERPLRAWLATRAPPAVDVDELAQRSFVATFTRLDEFEPGTQFNLNARSSETLLAVNEGRVRMKRLCDGRVVDVPAKHQALASIDELNGLTVTSRDEATHSWRSDLATDVTDGKWIAHLTMLGVRLKKAVASGEMTEADAIAKYKDAAILGKNAGSMWAVPWIVKGPKSANESAVRNLVVLSVSRGRANPVVLAAGARFRIQGTLHSPAEVVFGISANTPGGGFAGKYIVTRPANVLRGDGNAFDVEVPLAEFHAKESRFGESPIDKELANWWCLTTNRFAKLEITSVELLAP